jgi:hypothetical protein
LVEADGSTVCADADDARSIPRERLIVAVACVNRMFTLGPVEAWHLQQGAAAWRPIALTGL